MFSITLLWEIVAVTLALNKITVFNKGIPSIFIGSIPTGDHSSVNGDKEKWNQAQNHPAKNITSEKINKQIDVLSISFTKLVWSPFFLSILILSNHKIKVIVAHNNLRII